MDPVRFARLVVDAVRAAKMERRTSIQSFDWRTLIESRRIAPEINTVCLTIETQNMNNVAGNPLALARRVLRAARFRKSPRRPARVWSPFSRNLAARTVVEAHALGLKSFLGPLTTRWRWLA